MKAVKTERTVSPSRRKIHPTMLACSLSEVFLPLLNMITGKALPGRLPISQLRKSIRNLHGKIEKVVDGIDMRYIIIPFVPQFSPRVRDGRVAGYLKWYGSFVAPVKIVR